MYRGQSQEDDRAQTDADREWFGHFEVRQQDVRPSPDETARRVELCRRSEEARYAITEYVADYPSVGYLLGIDVVAQNQGAVEGTVTLDRTGDPMHGVSVLIVQLGLTVEGRMERTSFQTNVVRIRD